MVIREKIRHISLRILIALLVSVCVISASAEGEFDGYIVKLSEPLPVMTPFSVDDGICELEYHDNVYVIEDTSVIDSLEDEGVVLYVEPNYILDPLGTEPNDEKYLEQWTLDAINYPALYNGGYNGEGVVVAVIDSGLDISHPDFKDAKISPLSKNFLGDSINKDAYYRDQVGHGTFVTSQIAAVTDNREGLAGIASGVELMILRCLSRKTSLKYAYDIAYDSGSATVSKVSSAIKYAADNGADVINISLGMTSNSATLAEAVNYASSKGVIIVAAVGNSGDTSMYYPANCENVIGVGSVSRSGNTFVKSSFSQRNTSVDVAAPGGNVLGIQIYPSVGGEWYVSAEETYLCDGGTSYASPVVAALAAITKQINPYLDANDFLSLLAVSSNDLGTAGYDTSYGYGAVDAEGLLYALNDARYGIDYVLNDNSASLAALPVGYTDSYKLNAESEILLPVPKREGYVFGGWCFDENCSDDGVFTLPLGTLGSVSAIISNGEVGGYEIMPITLYAKWGIKSSTALKHGSCDIYTAKDFAVELIMPSNSLTGVLLDGKEVYCNAYVLENNFVKFDSQWISSLGVGTHILTFRFEFGDDATFTLNVTDSAPRFDVVFYPAFGFENAHFVLSDVRIGDTIGTLPEAPAFADRSFIGWYLSENEIVTPNTVVTADMAVYAVWAYTGDGEDAGLDESSVTSVEVVEITESDAFNKVYNRANGVDFALYQTFISGYVSPLGTYVNVEFDGESVCVYEINGNSFIKTVASVNGGKVKFKANSGSTYAVTGESIVLYGDANADGRLSLADITSLLKKTVNGGVALDFVASDIDGDGDVTVRDMLIALNTLLNG